MNTLLRVEAVGATPVLSVNKSHRKSYVRSVCALDEEGKTIDIKWGTSIDQHGNPHLNHYLISISFASQVSFDT